MFKGKKEVQKCIICDKDINELQKEGIRFNVEHIIPEGLGNRTLKIETLCEKCNSKLGSKIDAPFINQDCVKLIRESYNIDGKKNIVPTFFLILEQRLIKGPYRIIKKNNKYTIKPKVEEEGKKIKISASSREETLEIARKKLRREGYDEKKIEEIVNNAEKNFIKAEYKILEKEISYDIIDFQMESLKIAYEFACKKLNYKYFDSKSAEIIRKILIRNIDDDEKICVDKYFKICNYNKIRKKYLKEKLDENTMSHTIILFSKCNNLYCYLSLFNSELFICVVKLGKFRTIKRIKEIEIIDIN